VFTKTFVHLLGGGIPFMLSHWEPYALAASALGGLLLAQSSFQAGSLAASVAALEVSEPIVATVIGIGLLNEQIDTHGLGVQLGIALSVVAMFVGVVALSRSVGSSTTAERSRLRTFVSDHRGPRVAP